MLAEQKERVNLLRIRHSKEIEVLKQRSESSRKTCQSLQSYITSLYSKLEGDGRKHASAASSSQVTWTNHKCGERCRKSATFDGLDVPLPTPQGRRAHHEHSHRHALSPSASSSATKQVVQRQTSEPSATSEEINPFSSKTRTPFQSVVGMTDNESATTSSSQTNP